MPTPTEYPSVYNSGLLSIKLSVDGFVDGGFNVAGSGSFSKDDPRLRSQGNGPKKEIEIELGVDLISLDFTEDLYTNSMLGTLIVTNQKGWDLDLGSINGTEWITISFNYQNIDDQGKAIPTEVIQRFKAYKVTNTISSSGNLTTYAFSFCSYQGLIDNFKLERHLNDKHIGPISTESGASITRTESSSLFGLGLIPTGETEVDDSDNRLTNQDYGLVNKIFEHMNAKGDISITDSAGDNVSPIDIEPTANWINYVPAYLDNRNNESVLDERYNWGNKSEGLPSEDSRPLRVFEFLNELSENAVCLENSNAANFFVWNDLKGWHFRSIDSYLRDRGGEDDVDQTYTYGVANVNTPGINEATRIIDLQVLKQVDFMDLIASQALSSKIVYYELNPENELASYYMTLPENLLGATRVIGPNGFQDTVGETLVEQEAIEENAISYDYILDYDKWNKVETYPLLQDVENQFSDYSFPSFLEIPPAYSNAGAGNDSWFAAAPYDENDLTYRWYSQNRIGTEMSFRLNNRAEFFKQKFLRQTTLEGSKFRTVYDKIKTPIIKALRDYYNISLQRLYLEHNLVIEGGLNTLEAGEGKIGRGDGGSYCDYCLNREQTLSDGEAELKEILGNEEFQRQYIDGFTYKVRTNRDEPTEEPQYDIIGFDQVAYENAVINVYLFGTNVGPISGLPPVQTPAFADFLDYNINNFDGNAFQTCTAKNRDRRTQILGFPYIPSGSFSNPNFGEVEERRIAEFLLDLPVIEFDNVARVDESIQGQSYPRCTTPEPLLPYDGSEVDCLSIREKWEAIPSECALVSEHLGPEYVSPIIRGDYGQPINIDNMTFWNGYWINPRFGLPNRRNYISFFRDLDANFSGSEAQLYAVHESNMFLKDFLPNNLAETGLLNFDFGTPYLNTEGMGSIVELGYRIYDQEYATKYFGESYASHTTDLVRSSVTEGDIRNPTLEDPDPVQEGDKITTTFSVDVNYIQNPKYDKASICSTPFLCGHQTTSEETISVPYVKKLTYRAEELPPAGGFGDFDGSGVSDGDETAYVMRLADVQTSTISVKFPAVWSRGLPYNYGNISNLPKRFIGYQGNFLDSSYIEFLKQFGIINDDYLQNKTGGEFVIQEQNSDTTGFGNRAGIAELSGTLRQKGIETSYVGNRALNLYDANRPIYHKKDWQNFLDCRGTCVGSVADGEPNNINPEKNKAVEYAKLCSYAWNRYWSTPKEQPMYIRAQVALLQSQEVEITVPNDMSMSIGKLVKLVLPKSPSMGNETQSNNPIRGKYIVTGIRRVYLANNQQTMKLRLNRDSLPFDPNGNLQTNDSTE